MPVDSLHKQYSANMNDWKLIRDMSMGARHVKAQGELYLPKLTGQDSKGYERYLIRSSFLNATHRTIAGFVSMAFRRPMKVDLGRASRLTGKMESIGFLGESLDELAAKVLEEAITTGRAGLLVDRPVGPNGNPYISLYPTETITNWVVDAVTGKTVATVLKEIYPEYSGGDMYAPTEETQYRELLMTPKGYVQRVHRPTESGTSGYASIGAVNRKTYVPVQETQPTLRGNAFTEIPFFYVSPKGNTPEIVRSPMLDISDLNKHHYMTSADYNHGVHYTAIPTYYATLDARENASYSVGPDNVWVIEQGGTAGIIEFHGHGLTYLENALANYERQMALLGARLLIPQKGTAAESGEAVATRERSEYTSLWGVVNSVEAALTDALKLWVRWQDEDDTDVSIKINRNFIDAPLDARSMTAIMRLHQSNVLPLDAVVEKLFEGDVLPSTMSPEEVRESLSDPENLSAVIEAFSQNEASKVADDQEDENLSE